MSMSALHKAAVKGDIESVRRLLHDHADVTALNDKKQLPIYWSLLTSMLADETLRQKKETVFRMLWEKNPASVLHQDDEGDTVFHLLASQGYFDLLKDVLKKFPEGALIANNHGRYPIHTAILNGEYDCVKSFLKLEKVPQLADTQKQIPLHYAARYGSKDIMEACCEATPDLSITDTEGKDAWMLAHEAENMAALDVLAKHGIKETTQPRSISNKR